MRKLLISLGLLFLAVTVGASNAAAQSSTTLGFADTTTVSFLTAMGDTGMTVLATTGGAGGPGMFKGPLLASATNWSLDAGSLTLTPVPPQTGFTGTGTYTVSGTLNFTLKDGSATLLTGTLTFPNSQLSHTSSGDTLTLNANLTIASGSVCTADPSACMSGAQNHVTLVVNLLSNHVTGAFGVGQATIGNVAGLVTTPEPTSMLLFGTGLLAFGGILRRKLLA